MAKKRPSYNANSMIRGAIRRTFSRSPIVIEVRMAGRREVPKYNKDGSLAKKPAVQYQCEICQGWVGSTKIAIDHIEPVISTEVGFVDWNQFIDRLFCDKSNLQRICEPCHRQKTNVETSARQLKKDLELLAVIEKSSEEDEIKKGLKKFTKKKLIEYPKDVVQRVEKLKEIFGKKKKKVA